MVLGKHRHLSSQRLRCGGRTPARIWFLLRQYLVPSHRTPKRGLLYPASLGMVAEIANAILEPNAVPTRMGSSVCSKYWEMDASPTRPSFPCGLCAVVAAPATLG